MFTITLVSGSTLAISHLHEGLLGQLGGLKRDEAVQGGRGGAVGDVSDATGGRLGSRGRGADCHAGRRAHVDASAGGAQGACGAVGAYWRHRWRTGRGVSTGDNGYSLKVVC